MSTVAFDPTLPDQRENPFDILELARREQPVFYAEKFGLWVVTRHDDVLAVLKDHKSFSSEGALKSSAGAYPPAVQEVLAEGFPKMPYIIEVDPPVHDRIRGLITKAFTPRRVAELAPRIEGIALRKAQARGYGYQDVSQAPIGAVVRAERPAAP